MNDGLLGSRFNGGYEEMIGMRQMMVMAWLQLLYLTPPHDDNANVLPAPMSAFYACLRC